MFRLKPLVGVPVAACLVASMALGSMALMPRTAAAATTPTVTLTPTTVPLGGHIAISGSNFAANEMVGVTLSQYNGTLATLKTSKTGTLALTNVTIPTTFTVGTATRALSPGAHTLTLTGSASGRSVAFQITLAPSASVSVSSIALGGKAAVSGAGFAANEAVDVSLSQYPGTLATLRANGNGIVALTDVTIPTTFKSGTATKALSPGVHTLTLTGAVSHNSATTQITLTASSTVSVSSVPLGGQVAVSGAGFAANANVSVMLSQYPGTLVTLKADGNGILPLTNVTIPTTFQVNGATKALSPGMHTLTLKGSSNGRTVTMQLTLVPAVMLSSSSLSLGGQVAVSGAGFSANENVTVSISGMSGVLATIKANNNGVVPLTTVTIPTTLGLGAHTIILTGATSHRSTSLPVTLGPAAPATSVAVTPASTNRGGLITVSGNNFAPNESVNVTISGQSAPLATLTANAQGQVPPTGVAIPYSLSVGPHTLQLTGVSSKHTATESITVAALTPSITFSTATLTPGTTVTVHGTGFGRQEQVTLSLNGAALPTMPSVIMTTNGAFTASFVVPAGVLSGANTFSAVGNQSRISASSNVPGVAPAAATLYFAGASTMAGNHASLAILNTGAQPAHIALTFYYRNGVPGGATLTVAAHSRGTANLDLLAGHNRLFGLKLSADHAVSAQLRVLRSSKDGYGLLGVTAPNTTWYLAEGYTARGFHETLALVNPGSVASQVQLRLLPTNGHAARTDVVSVAPKSTQIVDVNSLAPNQSVSVIANASQPIVLERTITFSTGSYGITAKAGVNAPATSWIFAQGRFSRRVQSYLSILNPNTSGTMVTASFYGSDGAALGSRTVYVQALRRTTIKLGAAFAAQNVAAVVSSDLPVVVERPAYLHIAHSHLTVESDVFGRNGAGLSWAFPGGDTLSRSDALYVFNPSSKTATIEATFYGSNGMVVNKSFSVAPLGQSVIGIKALVPSLTVRHSTELRSTNGVGFVAAQTTMAPNGTALQSTQGFAS